MSTSLIISEMQIKTTMRYRLTSTGMAIPRKIITSGLERMWSNWNPQSSLVAM
jgi:hypothetical protein